MDRGFLGKSKKFHFYKFYYLQYFHIRILINSYTYSVQNLNLGSYYPQVGKIFSTNIVLCRFYYPYIDVRIFRVYFGNNNKFHFDKYNYLQYFHRDLNTNSYTYSVQNLNQGSYYSQVGKIYTNY
jgi:hypothetical protein